MKKNKLTALLIATAVSIIPAMSASNFSYSTQAQNTNPYQFVNSQYTQMPYTQEQQTPTSASQPLQGHVTVVPAGVNIPITTTSELNTQNLTLGQSVSAVLTSSFTYNGTVVAPAGSTVMGNVTYVKKGGHAGKNAQLQIRFTQINTPYGNIIPISAMIRTDDGTGILKSGTAKDTAKDYTKDLVIGSGAGAVLGLTMGALSGGSVGRGAIYGTAVGAGAGLLKSLWDKGVDVVIPANSTLDITIDQPVTVHSAN
ncbi:MAG: hypothetical protein K6C94_06255 [Candidatus Gastranaerophilales bacterium]|nr:hypothetical protein [Candidatus Gastranaerophilales bacterium]